MANDRWLMIHMWPFWLVTNSQSYVMRLPSDATSVHVGMWQKHAVSRTSFWSWRFCRLQEHPVPIACRTISTCLIYLVWWTSASANGMLRHCLHVVRPYLSGVVDTSRAPIGGILGGPLLKIKSSEYSAVARPVCGGYPPNISASSM